MTEHNIYLRPEPGDTTTISIERMLKIVTQQPGTSINICVTCDDETWNEIKVLFPNYPFTH